MVRRREAGPPGHGGVQSCALGPDALDPLAEAVALMGDGSFLWGEPVLSMHGLALVDPRSVSVATPKRVRRKLSDWVKAVPASKGASAMFYEGIPSQRVADAIGACEGSVMGERLTKAAKLARRGARHLRRIREPDEGAAMKEAKRPNSRRNLDIAIDRLCTSTGDEPGRVKRLLATAIYMLGSLAGSLIGGIPAKSDVPSSSDCVSTKARPFSVVDQDYTPPDHVLKRIGLEVFEYESFAPEKPELDIFTPKAPVLETPSFDQFEISYPRRSLIAFNRVGYI